MGGSQHFPKPSVGFTSGLWAKIIIYSHGGKPESAWPQIIKIHIYLPRSSCSQGTQWLNYSTIECLRWHLLKWIIPTVHCAFSCIHSCNTVFTVYIRLNCWQILLESNSRNLLFPSMGNNAHVSLSGLNAGGVIVTGLITACSDSLECFGVACSLPTDTPLFASVLYVSDRSNSTADHPNMITENPVSRQMMGHRCERRKEELSASWDIPQQSQPIAA